ncbi:MAG: hypothetical protein ACLQVD_17960 [Capsulimonadaceae bacterium]
MDHYEYYLLGCKARGVRPVSRRYFVRLYHKYLRHPADPSPVITPSRDRKRIERIAQRRRRLSRLDALVRQGRRLSANPTGEPGDGLSGRQSPDPRLTTLPAVSGASGRRLPGSPIRRTELDDDRKAHDLQFAASAADRY